MRRNFPAKVMALAFQRAAGRCEKCTARLVVGKFQYDHIIADALGGEPTLENCQVLCSSCHGVKTPIDTTKAAKVKRQTRKLMAGIRSTRNLIPGSKGTRFKRKLDGTTVLREAT